MGFEEKAKKEIAKKKEVRKAAEAYASGCKRIMEIHRSLREERVMEWSPAYVSECAKEIADMCRKLHFYYLKEEDKLYSIKGLRKIDVNIRKERIRIENKLKEDEDGIEASTMLLEEDIRKLFRKATACVGRYLTKG